MLLPKRASAFWEGHKNLRWHFRRFVGRSRKSRRREAAGRRNYPEAVPNGEGGKGKRTEPDRIGESGDQEPQRRKRRCWSARRPISFWRADHVIGSAPPVKGNLDVQDSSRVGNLSGLISQPLAEMSNTAEVSTHVRVSPLVAGCEAQSKASRRPDGVAGKQTSEVDYIQHVGEILAVNLQSHLQAFRLVNIRARRSIDLEGRVDAAASEIDAIHDLLAIFGERLDGSP